jgi:hypothetical protein
VAFRSPTSLSPHRQHPRAERGQAAVELVAALPALLVAGLLVWQIALSGYAAWALANAARVAARAALVDRDAGAAARSALPSWLERGLRVEKRDGALRVSARVPAVLPTLVSPLRISASAGIAGGDT